MDSVSVAIPHTACFWIGIYGALQVALWLRIISIRSPEDLELKNLAKSNDNLNLRVTRAHGNYTENAPMFSIMILAVDLCGVVPKFWIDVIGYFFMSGRFMHAIGLDAMDGTTVGRFVGALCTLTSLALGAGLCLYTAKDQSDVVTWQRVALVTGTLCAAKLIAPRIPAESQLKAQVTERKRVRQDNKIN
jgi:uncharacterized membrane protein YecN with MAPEG domain